jgi:ABC-type lipoprotein export system ATPase subunit
MVVFYIKWRKYAYGIILQLFGLIRKDDCRGNLELPVLWQSQLINCSYFAAKETM